MYIPQELVEEIHSKNDIVDVINSYVPLKRSGSGFVGLCPFHNEKTPSFNVSPQRQIFHCFGCHKGGNVVSFVMEYENLSFPEAMKVLADRVSVVIPENTGREGKQEASRRQQLLAVLKEAAGYYYKLLRSPAGEQGLRYFANRGITPEIAKHFGLGFAGKGNASLTEYLRNKGFETTLIKDAGLCIIDDKYGPRDRFFNRVMFPILDINKKVIGFGGRVMGDGLPKYINSPETAVFDKGRNLYGMNYAKTSRKDSIILVEGYMDVIAMHKAGFDQAVASLGTALTPGQAGLIGRVSKNVYISYDSDGAGTKAALKAIDILRDAGISTKIISLEPYKDPDELIKALGAEGMEERIKNAESSFDFRLRIMERGLDLKNPDEKTSFLKRAAIYLAAIDDELERENHITAIAERYSITQDIIRKLVRERALMPEGRRSGSYNYGILPKTVFTAQEGSKGYKESGGNAGYLGGREAGTDAGSGYNGKISRDGSSQNVKDPSLLSQKLLLSMLSEDIELYQRVKGLISPADFCNEICNQTADILFKQLNNGSCDPSAIVGAFTEPEESSFVAGIFFEEMKGSTKEDAEYGRVVKDLLVKVRTAGYLRDVENMSKDPEGLDKIIKGKQDIEQLKKMEMRITHGTK